MSDENVDLDEERKKEIALFDERLSSANHFELLGISAGATTDEVRNAFHALSRKFHPDRYYGKNLGSYKVKLDRIFRRLVEAHQVLSDPEKRKAWLDANPFARAAVRAAAGPDQPAVKTEEELARDKERQSRLGRHPYLARFSKVHEHVASARAMLAKNQPSQALSSLNVAAQIAPDNPEVKALLAEARKTYDGERAQSSYARGLEALERMNRSLALQAFKSAVQASGHPKAAAKAAELLQQEGAEHREITGYLQRAVDGEPSNVDFRLALARALEAAGMKAMAKKHLDEAARLAPDHPEVKKYVKRKWPF